MVLFTKLSKQYYTFFIPKYAREAVSDRFYVYQNMPKYAGERKVEK